VIESVCVSNEEPERLPELEGLNEGVTEVVILALIVRLCVELVVPLLVLGGDTLVLGLAVAVFEYVEDGVTERLRVVVRV
jgi:hypothetical protein